MAFSKGCAAPISAIVNRQIGNRNTQTANKNAIHPPNSIIRDFRTTVTLLVAGFETYPEVAAQDEPKKRDFRTISHSNQNGWYLLTIVQSDRCWSYPLAWRQAEEVAA